MMMKYIFISLADACSNMCKQVNKRGWLIILSILYLAPAQGQLKSELNLPRAGDDIVKEQVAYCAPGEAGENQTWDFSNLRLIDYAYTVKYFSRNDWKIIGTENGKLSFLHVTGDSLLLSGYENPTTLVRYQQPGLLMHFPLVYSASSESYFNGRGKHHDRLESTVSGEISTIADATGSLILPDGDTLKSVFRVHIRKIETARYIPLSSGFAFDCPVNDSLFSGVEPEVITTDIYQWYEEGYRYPILESIETYRDDLTSRILLSQDTYFYHPAGRAYLPEDKANQAVLERKNAARKAKMLEHEGNILSFNCYPNPVKERLEIELTLRQIANAEISLWDMNGRLMRRFQTKTPDTRIREILDMQSYPQGYYLVKIFAGKEMVSEKIVKN